MKTDNFQRKIPDGSTSVLYSQQITESLNHQNPILRFLREMREDGKKLAQTGMADLVIDTSPNTLIKEEEKITTFNQLTSALLSPHLGAYSV